MFQSKKEAINPRTDHYQISAAGKAITWAETLQLWQDDEAFRDCFVAILADSPFAAYRWETPPVTGETLDRKFEFVLVDSPGLVRSADRRTFAEQFAEADEDGIVVFENLGKDALMIVPAPASPDSTYDQLAGFMRSAPPEQIHALWRNVGQSMQRRVGDDPIWLSTAGGDVAWLHVRLDSRPKYYHHAPYKRY